MSRAITLFKEAFEGWRKDNVARMGAALAYYSIFSVAPLLIITIAIVGFVLGSATTRDQILHATQSALGSKGAEAVQAMIQNARAPGRGVIAAVIGVITLIFGASGFFVELQDSLNSIFRCTSDKAAGWRETVKKRLLTFLMVVGIAVLMLISLLLTAAVSIAGNWVGRMVPGGAALWQVANLVASFGLTSLLFASIFKVLPEARLTWRQVAFGSVFTALFFTLGKFGLGLYLGKSGVTSVYGAAGSLVAVLLWMYYSTQILLFGAELIQVRRAVGASPSSIEADEMPYRRAV